MLSHDDESPAMRQAFRAQGVAIAEFPVNEETAREAAEAGDFIVFGAPNVVRGGSHTGWTKASDMIAKGLCSVLASDYYYPAPLLAAFRLAADGVLPLAEAWQLISSAPARAAGLADRGVLAAGQRADIILVDDTVPLRPRIVARHCRGTPGASDGGGPSRSVRPPRRARQLQPRERGPILAQWQIIPVTQSTTPPRKAARSTGSARPCSATTPMAATTCPFRMGSHRTGAT